MMKEEKMSVENLVFLWGFIFIVMGILGVMQMGILEGLSDFIAFGSILMIIGFILLIVVIFLDKSKSK